MTRRPGAMRGQAALEIQRGGDGVPDKVAVMQARSPLALRNTHPKQAEPLVRRRRDVARVSLAAGAAGPLGGDDFGVDVHVGVGSTLVFNDVSATLVLPGPHGERSHMRTHIRVEAGATLVWLPEIVIAARGCNHDHDVRIDLAADARLVMREETLLGRHAEQPGRFTTTLCITHDDKPLYHQTLSFGDAAGCWNSAAVVGDNKAVGSMIVVDPLWQAGAPDPVRWHADALRAPLPGPGVVISAVAGDSLQLRRLLDEGLETLGSPWATRQQTA